MMTTRWMFRGIRRRSLSFKVTAANFQQQVVGNPIPVVLDCYADWCGPCKQLTPLLKDAVDKAQDSVQLAMLDTDQEQDLAMQLQIKSLPTVFGVVAGRVVDTFVGGQPKQFVDEFVAKLAKYGPPPAPQEDSTKDESSGLSLATKDPEAAIPLLVEELETIRAQKEVGKRRLSPEFDEHSEKARTAAVLLEALARCHMTLDAKDAASSVLAELRDPKRAAVLDKHADLKAAVAKLALDLAPEDDLRAQFSTGETESALDAAIDRVKAAQTPEERDAARRLVLDFIDALGPSPLANKARKSLANAIF